MGSLLARLLGSRDRLLALAAATVLVAGVACASDATDREGPAGADPGVVHVHGLGVNPRDGALYIATHTGLFRLARGERAPERVGDSLQDTMGFTVAGPDRFLASGHPGPGTNLPPHLGLVESSDGGRTWRAVSLLGEADFHALVADGERIYGFDAAGGRMLASADGGATWDERDPPGSVLDLAIHPRSADGLVAALDAGVHVSADTGRSWTSTGAPPGLVEWPAQRALHLLTLDGRSMVSADGGHDWTTRGRVDGEPAALTAIDADHLVAALHDGRLVHSPDGGRSWSEGAWPS